MAFLLLRAPIRRRWAAYFRRQRAGGAKPRTSAPVLRYAQLTLFLFASIATAACGQQGIVAATSTTGSSGDTGGGGGTGGSTGTGSGAAGGTGGTGGAETAMPLKVLNWNLHNFFDTHKDTDVPEEQVLTKSQYDGKVAKIGAVLKAMDADIAIVPEVEHVAILDDLNEKQLGKAYVTSLSDSNDFRGLDIGILSKVPIDKVVTHLDDSFKRLDLVGGQAYKYSRDCVEVHLTFNTRKVVLLGVHYRSKGTGMAETDDKDKRMAEAQHTRLIADEIAKAEPKTAIIILGDFNDTAASPPVSWTLQGNPKSSPKVGYLSAADSIAEADRYTFVYNGTKELIDHQIMNPLLQSMLDPASVTIRHGADVEDASDHHPLMATYQIQ
jgi:endonuclease/exonuclease/phosphatase family metal-dependent hydrolase